MNNKQLISVLIACSTLFFSCSKSSNPSPAPSNPIVGLWIGTLTAQNEPGAGALFYSFDIRDDSTILTYSEGADGNTYYNHGTWSLSGSAFSATTTADISGVVQNITAVYSNDGNLSSGIWANKNGTASGAFSLKRVD